MHDLRVLICEDEYLLASGLARELGERGVTVVGTMSSIADTLKAMEDRSFDANVAILDIRLLDGFAFELVAPMLARGVAVVFCTGYGSHDLPTEFAHFPSVGKPTDIDELLEVLGSLVLKGNREATSHD